MLKIFRQIKLTFPKVDQNKSIIRKLSVLKCDDLDKPNDQKTEEDRLRCKLAATYRLVASKKWDMSIYNHITVRSKQNPDHFYINPFGLLYSEMTAGGMLKIDTDCNVIEPGNTTYGLNFAGFTLHSAIHDAREDINAVLHVHTAEAAGASALRCGFLPISQEAIICTAAGVGYHDYGGVLVDTDMRQTIAKDLSANRILVLRNHGAAFCGSTIEEAFFWLYTFMTAVRIQHIAMSSANGVENLVVPPSRITEQMKMLLENGAVNSQSSDGIEWGLGEMEFEAEMRLLDSIGHKTGYPYKKPPTNYNYEIKM